MQYRLPVYVGAAIRLAALLALAAPGAAQSFTPPKGVSADFAPKQKMLLQILL